ncbi:Crp/Fnr family transcriptional regulator [Tenacibaculum salmonis]|uniref:Crp/Fnr family transcriptional regulator n=1 Tax=Tenacibaculum sp. P3-BQ1 TaxID=3232310 RepID=UPI0034DDE838
MQQKKLLDFGIPLQEIEAFFEQGTIKKIPANTVLLKESQTCNSFTFLKSGITRHYIITNNGKEITKNFTTEKQFVFYSISSFLDGKPSKVQFQTLTDCELIQWNKKKFNHFFYKNNWKEFYHHILQNIILKKEEKEISHLKDDAQKRYENFLYKKGNLLNQIPNYHIASYLGITPETLSRIRKKHLDIYQCDKF